MCLSLAQAIVTDFLVNRMARSLQENIGGMLEGEAHELEGCVEMGGWFMHLFPWHYYNV
jgi:hypothetical protein